ncbi:MAG: methyltransferase domain-containing protein [Verrucomicrobia bacterium]|nr:methyltransferase domain-containing protein [Verrucomicrobiota bacterium]MBS0637531.1 methyltransferase domain-containing protein [Verrucomicrobiota bacterium]
MDLEEVYSPKYCQQLEAAYGPGMMSEGGTAAIEHLFDSVPMQGTKALDIGSGLGGVAFFVADRYNASVIGLEINAWMVQEAKKRTPEHLQERVDFVRATDGSWPFADGIFDVIFSKGVLTHVEDKTDIMNECYRTLKPGGLLVISDALSSESRKWGEQINHLNEMESLNMYPESESGYIKLLEKHNFILQSVRDDNKPCKKWTLEIINRLKNPANRAQHLHYFDPAELEAHIEGYEAMLKALETGELRSVRFIAKKGL